jgi:NAD(P)-dependent dehydrogenase (short-subunit alcohol dehydrogenase family)
MMAGRLDGRVAIVAGGATGIGAATAKRLASEGASVVIGDINIEFAGKVAAEIGADGGVATAVYCDIGDEASVAAMVKAAVDHYGGLDLIHINAADLSIIGQDLDVLAVSMAIFDRTIEINLRGHVLCTRLALPEMLKRGGGVIVYTSSGAAYDPEPTRVSYAVSKAGLHALMRHVAKRWGKDGIRANVVAPGLVLSETAKAHVDETLMAKFLAAVAGPRLGKPEDLAATVAFLMSPDGEWINGQVISVDGGTTMR